MIELAQLFQDVEAAVVQQEPAVEEIETKAAVINDNVGKANQEIDGAIVKARSRNRKKWICLGLVCKYYTAFDVIASMVSNEVLVLLVIIIVLVVVLVLKLK